MSTLKVDAIKHNSATSDAITTAADGTCTARITGMTGGGGLSHRNIIINGAMMVAQRSVSSSATSGYNVVDRIYSEYGGTDGSDGAITFSQSDVASGTTPYNLGFRKAYKVLNGDQTSGAGAGDFVTGLLYKIEAQDLANSGWNYTSSSGYLTLSFWVKASVAQNYFGELRTADGTSQSFIFETGSLTANTWTKVTKTIPGNSNLTFNNDNGLGMYIALYPFYGTTYTNNANGLEVWEAAAGDHYSKDNTTTWWTTDNATFEVTGLQLEVGDTATSFEHRSFGEELSRCCRYFYRYKMDYGYGQYFSWMSYGGTDQRSQNIFFPTTMRTSPSMTYESTMGNYQNLGLGGTISAFIMADSGSNEDSTGIRVTTQNSITSGSAGMVRGAGTTNGYFDFSAEL